MRIFLNSEKMNIVFGDLFNDISAKQFGVDKNDVTATIRGPDELKRINMGTDQELLLYIKKLPSGEYLLVECQRNGEQGMVGLVYRLPRSFIDQVGTNDPLRVLEEIANRFGQPISVGDEQRNFIAGDSFPIPPGQNANIMSGPPPPQGHQMLPNMLIRVREEGGSRFLDVSLAYNLDITTYLEFLESLE